MRTGYLYHEIFGWHDTGSFVGDMPSDPGVGLQPYINYENSDTKRRIHELIVVSGLIEHLIRIEPRLATIEELERCHTREHIERIKKESTSRLGGDGGDLTTPFAKGGFEIAAMAAGGAIEMLDAVLAGRVDNGYALIRPPGHHAVRERGMGYCIFSNMAVAIAAAKVKYGKDLRVAVVDWDVHHGNGTQDIFRDDPTVLTISLHQDRLYPHETGDVSDRGPLGSIINIPLPPGTGNGGYYYAMEQVVIPALERFKPDVITIASGFDSAVFDPLGRMLLTAEGFKNLTQMLTAAAARLCDNKIMATHEGGYNAVYSPFCGLFVLQELSGVKKLDDPFNHADQYPGHELKAHEKLIIERASEILSEISPE
jgi:acetoin utilization deacetylase AcuC-like enzyme